MHNIPHSQNLSKHEIENPHLVFYQLFDYAGLSQLKQHLWFWLRLTITGGYNKKYVHYNERDRIINLYEHLEKLLEASYLLYSERKEELKLLHRKLMEDELMKEDFDSTENA
jgi:hypothetical protein